MTATLTITKKVIEGISFTGKTVTYNGEVHSLSITGVLPSGVEVSYENNDKSQAGTYEVVAKFKDTTGNYADLDNLTAKLVINKATYDMSGVSFDDITDVYNGKEHVLVITGILPEGVSVSYTANKLTNVGTLEVIATFTGDYDNYNEIDQMTATLQIIKASLNVVVENVQITYGDNIPTESTIIVTGFQGNDNISILDQSSLVYTFGAKEYCNVGTYTISASGLMSDNYDFIYTAGTLTVNQLEIEFSWSKLLFIYDGSVKYVTATPTNLVGSDDVDLIVSYVDSTITDAVRPGVYNVYISSINGTKAINYKLPDEVSTTFEIYKDGSYLDVTFVYEDNSTVLYVVENGKVLSVLPEIPEKEGYYGYWSYDYSRIKEDTIINVVYRVNEYDIKYVLGELVNDINNPTTYTITTPTFILNNATTDIFGTTFDGWYTTSTYEEESKMTEITLGSYGDITLYGKLVYHKIESATGFEINEEAEIPTISMSVANTIESIDLSTLITVSTGATWTLSVNDVLSADNIVSLEYGENISYITVTNEEYSTTYKVLIYRSHMYTYSFYDGEALIYSSTAEQNSIVEFDSTNYTLPTKTGYHLIGWSTSIDGSIYDMKLSIDNMNLYPVFSGDEYVITYDANGGTVSSETQNILYDDNITLLTPTRDGYTFLYWTYNDVEFTDTIYKYESNITLVAVWQANSYTISFDTMEGEAIEDIEVYFDSSITLPTPVREGYTFIKWIDEDGNEYYVDRYNTYIYPDNLNLKAVWEITLTFNNVYDVTYDTITITNIDLTYTPQLFDGCVLGWFIEKDLINEFTFGTTINQHITLYSKFEYNFTYVISEDETVSITSIIDKEVLELEIPNTVHFYEVVSIESGILSGMDSLTKLTIPFIEGSTGESFIGGLFGSDNYEDNGEYVPNSLKEVYITGNHLIDDYAFFNCYYLEKIVVSGDVSSIGCSAFSNCTSLKHITIPFVGNKKDQTTNNNFGYIFGTDDYKENDLYVPSTLKEVVIRSGKIADCAFQYCKNIEKINLLDKVTFIGISSFRSCESLVDITIGSGVTSIGAHAFRNCFSLKEVVVPNNVKTIGRSAFRSCNNLVSIATPSWYKNSSKNYNFGYLFGSPKLEDDINYVPSTLNKISITSGIFTKDMFGDFNQLIDLELLNISISGYYPDFKSVSWLRSIKIDANITIDKYMFADCENLETVELYNIKSINSYAFTSSNINNIVIGQSITSIPENAFAYTNINSINIPEGVKTISTYAFYNCKNLSEVTLPSTLTTIGYYAFAGTNISNITIPENVNSIDGNAFADCENLINVEFKTTNLTYINSNLFSNTALEEVIIPEGVTSIYGYAFSNCINLREITLPSTLTSISSGAFTNCTKLIKVVNLSSLDITIGNSSYGGIGYYLIDTFEKDEENIFITEDGFKYIVKSDGSYEVYEYINDDVVINFPETINGKTYSIYRYMFYNNKEIEEVYIPDTVTELPEYLFYSCSNLKKVVLPSRLKNIPNYLFAYCESLEDVNIPEGVVSVGNYAFAYCKSIKTIDFNDSLKIISGYAFNYANVNMMFFPVTLQTIQSYAFSNSKIGMLYIPEVTISIETNAFQNASVKFILNNSDMTIKKGYSTYGYIAKSSYSVINDVESIVYENDYLFALTSQGYTLLDYYGYEVDLVLPNLILDCSYDINEYAFYSNDNIISVIIPEGVRKINDYAFYGCDKLEKVTIPSTVNLIKGFGSLTNFKELYYCGNPNDWVGISYYISGGEAISPNCFDMYMMDNTGEFYLLQELVLTVNWMNFDSFRGVKSINSVTFPTRFNGTIGTNAFRDCYNIVEIYNYSVYFDITLGATGNGYVGLYANVIYTSEQDSSLINTEDGYKFTKDSDGNYYLIGYCGEEENLVLPGEINGSTYIIRERAFYANGSIKTITINSGLSSIEKFAFAYCSNLELLIINGDIDTIYDHAFSYSTLKEIIINGNVYEITNAFYKCESLEKVTFNGEVSILDSYLFSECDNLKYINIPKNIVDFYCYIPHEIESIYIHKNVERIEYYNIYYAKNVYYEGTIDQWCNVELYYDKLNINKKTLTNFYLLDENEEWYLVEDAILSENVTVLNELQFAFFNIKTASLEFVKEINGYAFYNCTNLLNVILGEELTEIKVSTFYNCSNVNMNLPDTIQKIGSSAFYECTSLNVSMPKSLSSIGLFAFEGCNSIESVEFGDSLIEIGMGAFENCENIISVTFSDAITIIPANAFYRCFKLKTIEFGKSIKTIEYGNFYDVNSVKYRGTIEEYCDIDQQDIAYSKANLYLLEDGEWNVVTELEIIDGITTIPSYVFDSFVNITKMTIPSTITELYSTPNCSTKPLDIYYNGTLDDWCSLDICCLFKHNLYFLNENSEWELATNINISVEKINDGVFYKNVGLKEVVFDEGVIEIGNNAFYDCYNLENISLPSSLITIGQNAFYGTAIRKFIANEGLETIGGSAFYDCTEMVYAYISSTVTTIGSYAFSNNELSLVINNSSLSLTAGSSNYGYITLNVKEVISGDYYSSVIDNEGMVFAISETNAYFVDYIGDSEVVTIPSVFEEKTVILTNKMFNYNDQVKKVILSDGFTELPNYAFSNNVNIEEVVLPSSLLTIGNYALYQCTNLKICDIPSSVTSIGSYAFSGCSSLSVVVIPEGVKTINSYTFANCTNLREVILPSTLKSIGSYAFDSCQNLVNLYNNSSLNITKNSYSYGYIGRFVRNIIKGSSYNPSTYLEGDFVFSLYDDTYTLINYFGTSSIITTPNSSNGYTYNLLPYFVSQRNDITELYLNGIENIGARAFYNCSSLTKVAFSDDVVIIGEGAFYSCDVLSTIEWGNKITTIGDNAFYSINTMINYTFPDSLKTIGASAFANNERLISVTLPSSLESIGDKAFYNCYNLREIYDYSQLGITKSSANGMVGFYAYVIHTEEEESIIEYEGDFMYFMNANEEYVMIGYTGSKENLILPDNYKGNSYKIGSYIFSDYPIETLEIPSGVTSIGEQTFYSCSNLKTVTISSSVTSISNYAFRACSNIENVYYNGTIEQWLKIKTLDESTPLTYASNFYVLDENNEYYLVTEIIIPTSITSLGYIFIDIPSVKKIVLHSGITSIVSDAFTNCPDLETLVIMCPNVVFSSYIGYPENGKIYYYGNEIQLESTLSKVNNFYTNVYTYSEEEPTDVGEYWHYDSEGNIAIWEQ